MSLSRLSEGDTPFPDHEVRGRGGQGTVYLARDSRLGRRVALKVLSGLGTSAPEVLARFRREAELASRLEYPDICAILEAGPVEGTPFIAMRYLEGATLADRIAKVGARQIPSLTSFVDFGDEDENENTGVDSTTKEVSRNSKVEIRRTVGLIERVARALHATHEQGVILRDIKPGNIFVTPEGHPVLLDFGLARDLGGEFAELTCTGDVLGTPAYMSPEQIRGNHARIDGRTDIWALGVVLFESLTGQRPFQTTTREGLCQAILKEPIPDPSKRNPYVSRDLTAILETAIERRLVRPYQSAEALADDLRHFPPRCQGPSSSRDRCSGSLRNDSPRGTGVHESRVEWEPGPRSQFAEARAPTGSQGTRRQGAC
ncbi:MAG: serine/threonine protein kinase [Planctomycetes bacterium]|nr:serine/threonine protein kinase [Planctomycetota bacterium]